MARYLVIAHQTAESPELLERLRQLAEADSQAEFTILVPATPVCNVWICDEVETARVARERAAGAEERFKGQGLRVLASRAGDADPVEALRDELMRDDSYEAIVISTFPPGISRWLKMDVLARAARLLPERPIISVIASSVPAPVEASHAAAVQP
jgi:hypothetical protein